MTADPGASPKSQTPSAESKPPSSKLPPGSLEWYDAVESEAAEMARRHQAKFDAMPDLLEGLI